MKKVLLLTLFCLVLLPAYGQKKLEVWVFYSPRCKSCLEVKEEVLPAVKEKYQQSVEWRHLDILGDPENLSLLKAVSSRFAGKKALVPSVLVGNVFLIGEKEIATGLETAIEDALQVPFRSSGFLRVDLRETFNKLSVFTVMASGLVDGINPCAFAVIVFFISFLSVYGYGRKEVVYAGTAYCLAVFITYLLLGLGLFKFLYALEGVYVFIKAFYYGVAFFCFVMAILAGYDYFQFKRTKNAQGALLQLPRFLKKRINVVIGSGLRDKKQRGFLGLAAVAFGVGFLVSLLEAACTGQIYLPTIVFILKNADLKFKSLAYLFIYNLMFVLPLIIIFSLSLSGVSSVKFNTFLKQNAGRIKVIMVLVFFVLGFFILALN